MDVRTGVIYSQADIEKLHAISQKLMGEGLSAESKKTEQLVQRLVPITADDERALRPMNIERRKNWMRNRVCVCGSGKKFKKCCWGKYE